jgi:hypothetical protein
MEWKAAKRGIVTERGIAKGTWLSLLSGERFDEMPAVDRFLPIPVGTPEQRLETLFRSLGQQAARIE